MAQTDMVRSVAETWKVVAAKTATETPYGSPELAADIKTNVPSAGRALRFFRGLGIYDYRSEYGAGKDGGQLVLGHAKVTLDEGLTAIYKHFDAGRPYSWFESGNPGGTPKQFGVGKGHHTRADGTRPSASSKAEVKADAVVIADERSREEVRAIAGPEPEAPMQALRAIRKDEPEALVEAARQYANRTIEVQKHIEALAGLGVEVDIDKVMAGISLTPDPILEAVATLIPYIDRIERSATTARSIASGNKDELIELRRSVGVITKERNDLKAANQRLSERNIRLAAEASGKVGAQA